MTAPPNFSFADHVALLDQFLARRGAIVERIEESLLNVRGKETATSRDRSHFERLLNECFFGLPGLAPELLRLKGQLAATHLADGFEPIQLGKFASEFDPLELIVRAYGHWNTRRWPGRSGRIMYAQTIYSVFLLRQLENLSLRMWDDGNDRADGRLQELQALLDQLNAHAGRKEMRGVYVRDVRWLVQTAQGGLTKHLEPYFRVAAHVAGSFTDSVRLGFHAAGAKLAGGHLRSQLRYRALEANRALDDPENLAVARNSNSMDAAILLRDLVPLLKAYDKACAPPDQTSDQTVRLDLADAILQGVTADTELFLTRLDLLGPCTMIEDLFIERTEDGGTRYTPLGGEHMEILDEYRELIGRLAEPLKQDAAALTPAPGAYSPFGISYGFAADLLSNMALETQVSQSPSSLSFEDTFASRGSLEDKLLRAKVWSELPTLPGERDHFSHSAEFAAQTFARLIAALDARAQQKSKLNASNHPDSHIYVMAESESAEAPSSGVVAHADEYCYASDLNRTLSGSITSVPANQMLIDRNEGRYLASAESTGEWFAVSKVILTLFTAQGRDAQISGVPPEVIEILRLTCPGLVVLLTAADAAHRSSIAAPPPA
jgi:hypothetical protein